MRKYGFLLAVVGLLLVVVSLLTVGCGDKGTETPATAAAATAGTAPAAHLPKVMTVQQAVDAKTGPATVVGAVIATFPTDGTRPTTILTQALAADSQPPVPGGPTIEVKNLDLDSLVGLSSSVGKADVTQEKWTDYYVILQGTLNNGVFEVQQTPAVLEKSTADLRVRFSMANEPLNTGQMQWWTFDVQNLTQKPLELTFPTGQRTEVVLSQNGVEKYRWSKDLMVTGEPEKMTLQPGEVRPLICFGSVQVPPGTYQFTASLTGTSGPDDQAVQLPVLEGTVQVY